MATSDAQYPDEMSVAVHAVRRGDAGPLFVGPEDAPEAVVLAMDDYRSVRRHAAVSEALGSVRADGIDPGPVGLATLGRVARGEVGYDAAVSEVLARYRRQ